MMQITVPRSWKDEFAAVAARREDVLHRERLARFEDRERRRKEDRLEDERRDASTMTAMDVVLATMEDVARFRVELDTYDTATVEALMENREALDAVRERIDVMLMDAHVLPDGTRVFKTEDGLRVFDEHGQEIPPETIDPAEIDDRKPKWEAFQAEIEAERVLIEKQKELLAYQQKLDEARERLDAGDITQQELEDIKADLAADMPNAVREKLGIEERAADVGPSQTIATVEPALPANMDALMRQTGLGAGPSGP